MQVTVLAFGALKELLGWESRAVELPMPATAGELLDRIFAENRHLDKLRVSLAIAVNREYVRPQHFLAEGDEVALLPPVSGGAEEPLVRLQAAPIAPASLLARLKDGADGAVAIFDGIVRNHTRGRRTLYLIYEAYEAMALAEMQSLTTRAKQQFAVREIALLHRLGRLEIGESSVWIAVAAAHRGPAFDACRFVIDTLKKTVPIWKKEYFEDGAVWAESEPFPEA